MLVIFSGVDQNQGCLEKGRLVEEREITALFVGINTFINSKMCKYNEMYALALKPWQIYVHKWFYVAIYAYLYFVLLGQFSLIGIVFLKKKTVMLALNFNIEWLFLFSSFLLKIVYFQISLFNIINFMMVLFIKYEVSLACALQCFGQ